MWQKQVGQAGKQLKHDSGLIDPVQARWIKCMQTP